ncbi:MAG: hypothetical protein J5J00_14150 [Deltaproteobacteria bacterium]|nr:hypothetical protein [Deltaproteobacteria bacterium]
MGGVKELLRNERFSRGLRRAIFFFWLALIALIGLYQGGDPANWAQASFLERFAAQFPELFAFIAAIIMFPIYALTPFEYLIKYLAGFDTAAVFAAFYVLLGIVYLYWLAGVLSRSTSRLIGAK